MIGQTLSHYRIEEKIGAGGMGEVYRARDEHLDRDVVIKVLPAGTLADEHARKRFHKEAQALSKLNHPNIATVHDFDTQDGVDFIVMELVEGVPLSEKLKTGHLAEKDVTALGSQIADALEEAHERGIVHRDLKPGNVAVTPKGWIKVLDFGLARMLRPLGDEATTEAMTEELSVAGTLPYMSPEELKGERADHRSDLYSFGVVLYEMATGKRPFEERLSTALVGAILNESPEPPSSHNRKVSPGLESIILKALDKDPDHRYQSAREMRVDLERLSTPVSGAVPKRKPARSSPWLWAAAGVFAVMAILFALNAGGVRDRLLVEPGPRIDSIAVLPLENLSGDPEQEYFADGMTDALITDLSKIGALKVISRTSAMRYKDTDKSLPEIARELNVDGIVEGSVLRAGDQVRITAQLIEAASDQNLWAESYERDLRDILSLQREVARTIAQEIKVELTAQEESLLSRTRPVNPEAHEAYLLGGFYMNTLSPDGIRKAIEYYHQAIDADSNHALAYTGLARCYSMSAYWGFTSPHEAMPRAKTAALKAIELEPNLAGAHASLGWIRMLYDWDWLAAERELKLAIKLNPGFAGAHGTYGDFLAAMGQPDEGMVEKRRAQELDPLSLLINLTVAWQLHLLRQYDEEIEQSKRLLVQDPDFIWAHWRLAEAYNKKGMYEESLEALKSFSALSGKSEVAEVLDGEYAASGYHEAIRKAAKILATQSNVQWAALFYAMAEEKDETFRWLERAYEERRPFLVYLKVWPMFDSLRDDPRFQDLLRRMNFPD